MAANYPHNFPKSFVDTLVRGVKTGMARERSKAATKWLRDIVRKSKMSTPEIMQANKNRMRSEVVIGAMYLFQYDPKHKLTLPYYDIYPLIFPVGFYKDGFLGINMHYLPPLLRARLMQALYALLTNNKMTAATKLQISYQILQSSAKYKYFKPCLKRYLYKHVRSRYMRIQPIEWDFVLWTPLASFQKRSTTYVWQQSKKSLGMS